MPYKGVPLCSSKIFRVLLAGNKFNLVKFNNICLLLRLSQLIFPLPGVGLGPYSVEVVSDFPWKPCSLLVYLGLQIEVLT